MQITEQQFSLTARIDAFSPSAINVQSCQYNYTIGTNLQVIITQADPVCLICPNIYNDLWAIGADIMPANPAAPYILYVPSPATTFLRGPTVACNAAGSANIISSTGIAKSLRYLLACYGANFVFPLQCT